MIKKEIKMIKKVYSEYYVNLNFLNFLEVSQFKVKVFEFLVDFPSGNYEANLNISVEDKNYTYDPNIEKEPKDFFYSFVGYGHTEEEAIDNLVEFLKEDENIEDLKHGTIRIDF